MIWKLYSFQEKYYRGAFISLLVQFLLKINFQPNSHEYEKRF